MIIVDNSIVSIHYELKNEDGVIIESTFEDAQPMTFIQGRKDIVFGLEKALYHKMPGDKFSVVVNPEDAYGEYNVKLVDRIDKSMFDISRGLEVGMKFQAKDGTQISEYKIIEVNDDSVVIDGNHLFAGVTLYFDITILEVRKATDLELAIESPVEKEVR